MQNYRMLIFLIPLILERIHFTNAEPKPLVSSSGMITMKEPTGNFSESPTTTPQPPAVVEAVLEPITTPTKQSILLRPSSGGELSVLQKADNHPAVPERSSAEWSNSSVATPQTDIVPFTIITPLPPPTPSNVTLNHDLIRAYTTKNNVEVIENGTLTKSLSADGGTSLTQSDHGSQNKSSSHGVSGKRDVEAQEGFDENDTIEEGEEDDGNDKLPVFGEDESNEAIQVGNESSHNEKLVMTFEEDDDNTEASSAGGGKGESTNPASPHKDPLPVGFSFDENESVEATEAGSDEDESVEATIVGNGEDELPSSHTNKLVITFDENRGINETATVVSTESESANTPKDPFPVAFPFDEDESAEATIAGSGEDESVEATIVGNGEDELPNPNNNKLVISFDEDEDQKPSKSSPGTHTDSYPGEDFKTTHDDPVPIYNRGPPWKDEKIIGREPVDGGVEQIEISFALASKLCAAMDKEYGNSDIAYRVYLWAPINQYLPMIHKAFPVRSPLFAPECLKWAHRPCRGATRSPMLKPCSYWAPMRIRRPECGFIPNQLDKMVNYRDPSYAPGNCPCVWPCLRRFDPIQRCRVKVSGADKNLDEIEYSGDPKKGKELQIQINYAQQLCRSMRPTMKRDNLISISWLPIRITPIPRSRKDFRSAGEGGTRKKKRSNHSHKSRKHKSRKSKGRKHKKHLTRNQHKNHSLSKNARYKRHNANKMLRNPKQHFHNKRFTSTLPIEVNNDISEEPDGYEEQVEEDEADFTLAGSFNPDRFNEEAQVLPEDMNVNAKGDTANNRTEQETYDETNALEDFQKLHVTSNSCHIWKYKACLRKESSEELDNNELQNPTVIESTEQEASNLDCGQWYHEASDDCTPEELLIGDDSASELGPRLIRKPRVKHICPGNRGKFPCFLNRRKRLLRGTGKRTELRRRHTNNWKLNYDAIRVLRKDKSFRRKKKRGLFLEDLHDIDNSTTSDEDNIEDVGGIPLPVTGEDGDGNSGEERMSSTSSFIRLRQDESCRCDWPCLPFYDSINRCYDHKGNILVDGNGKPIVPTRSFRKHQQDPVACINFAENDEIYCKIKQGRRVHG